MSGPCCLSGSVDTDAVQLGTERTLGGVDVYWAPQPATKSCVAMIVVTDVFGWKLPNARLLADSVSNKLGVTAIVPDIFRGGACNPECMQHIFALTDPKMGASFGQKCGSFCSLLYNFVPFLLQQSHAAGAAVIKQVIAALQAQDPTITQIVLAGYCWGGHIAIKLSQDETIKGLTAIYAAHAGGLKIPQDYQLIRRPACIVIAGLDFEVKAAAQEQIKDTMEAVKDRVISQVHVVADVHHGFAMRGSNTDPVVREKRLEAEQFLADWIRQTCTFQGQ